MRIVLSLGLSIVLSTFPTPGRILAGQDPAETHFEESEGEQKLPAVLAVWVDKRYALGLVHGLSTLPSTSSLVSSVRRAAQEFKTPYCQVAFYQEGKTKNQGVLAVAESKADGSITVLKARNEPEQLWLERLLAIPLTPQELCSAYFANPIMADEDFLGREVVFEGTVADIAKGALNQPFVFFPVQQNAETGLTCYFPKNTAQLRSLRRGSKALVRGRVKGLLMQDVLLEQCSIISFR